MNIEHLSNDQLMRLQDIAECLDSNLRGRVTDVEILELLRVRLCFDPYDVQGFEIEPEAATADSPFGIVAKLGFEAPTEMVFGHELALVTC